MLTTLETVKRELKQTNTDQTAQNVFDEQLILDMIDRVVEDLNQDPAMYHQFVPTYETRYWDLLTERWGGWINGDILRLNDDLLVLDSITQDGTAISTDDVLLLPRGDRAARQLKLINNATWDLSATDPEDGIAITGEWGFHHRPSQRWKVSGSTLQADINATITTITVDNADGVGIWGDAPRFSPGHLIAIEDEWMSVRSVTINDAAPDDITVLRGVQGTTATAHVTGKAISIWNPIAEAQRYATRAAMLAYRRSGELTTVRVEGVTEVVYPTAQTMPEYKHLQRLIADYVRTV